MNWWGYHKHHGWVVLDRSIARNRPGLQSDILVFVRCRDAVAFEAERSTWNPPEFMYEPNYLKTLSAADCAAAIAQLEDLKGRSDRYHGAAVEYISEASRRASRRAWLENIEREQQRTAERNRMLAQQAERHAQQLALAEAARRQLLEEERRRRSLHFEGLRSHLLGRQKAETDRIRQWLHERNIRTLVHFTRAENLPSIVSQGLLPRASLQGGEFVANDDVRIDGMPEASCLSISFPNYRMFYRYRKQNEAANWGVLQMSTQVLLEKPCLFLPTNAASSTARDALNGNLNRIIGARGLEGMFEESPAITRVARGLSSDLTTDPQAEVLVLDAVEPEYFVSIALFKTDPALVTMLGQARAGLPVACGGPYFKPRHDYQWWTPTAACDDVLADDDQIEF